MVPVRRSGTVFSVDREYKRPGPIIVIDYEALKILDARALDGTVYTDFQEPTSFPSCLRGHSDEIQGLHSPHSERGFRIVG